MSFVLGKCKCLHHLTSPSRINEAHIAQTQGTSSLGPPPSATGQNSLRFLADVAMALREQEDLETQSQMPPGMAPAPPVPPSAEIPPPTKASKYVAADCPSSAPKFVPPSFTNNYFSASRRKHPPIVREEESLARPVKYVSNPKSLVDVRLLD